MSLNNYFFKKTFAAGCPLLAAILLLSIFSSIQAQGGGVESGGTGGRHVIRGRIVFPSGQRADLRLKVRLESSGYGELSVFSDSNGSFTFQALTPGSYTVVIEGGEFYETAREPVHIEPPSVGTRRPAGMIPISRPFTVQVYLRPKPDSSDNRLGVLSATLATAPKPAAALYIQAMESVAKGMTDKAIAELKQSLTLFPGFGLALNELGVQYMKLGQIDKAAEVLRSAVSLLPDAFEPRLNYGIALLNQNKFAEAEGQLRESLRKHGSAFTPHMYLGIALINLKNYQEAEAELLKAISLGGTRVGQAHYYLGGIYWRARDYKKAAIHLEKYLEMEPKAANAEKIKATIKDLRTRS
ncbi:MAG TPA: tetratricopeptide repeat protein [Pyrinomonadaceae bacterium]|nr:tetratricopeptide repeat protein [Pyrinomonadaceae bacterium]